VDEVQLFMSVHVIADTVDKLSILRAMLEGRHVLTTELLGGASNRRGKSDAVVVTVDLQIVENIATLRTALETLTHIRKRIFLIDQKARLFTVQAYALGATHVLIHPVSQAKLLAKLANNVQSEIGTDDALKGSRGAAMAGAAAITSMFSAVLTGKPVDVGSTKDAGGVIVDSLAEDGLSSWLEVVRRHHEGTYQHCLLVAGITVDFGLSLGLPRSDVERLYMAAMFHDIGKAKIPLSLLDKPGHLDAQERTLIETHPAIGYDALKQNAAISPEVLDAVRHHHEYLDGSGYPDGLSDGSISDIVRILTISDIFSALIERRSYKSTMPREDAYEIIRGMHGKLEVPLVAAFKDVALYR
jgi:putative nucleotidyltransferase with HDIG domain